MSMWFLHVYFISSFLGRWYDASLFQFQMSSFSRALKFWTVYVWSVYRITEIKLSLRAQIFQTELEVNNIFKFAMFSHDPVVGKCLLRPSYTLQVYSGNSFDLRRMWQFSHLDLEEWPLFTKTCMIYMYFRVYMYCMCTINELSMLFVSFVSTKKDFYMNHVSFVNVDVYDIEFICWSCHFLI